MYCSNCGHKMEENFKVCLTCGRPKKKEEPKVRIDNSTAKSKLIAVLLALFFGVFGIHNFYLGYNGKGLAQLLITLISFGFLSGIVYLWAVIEAILILTGSIDVDSDGVLLK